MRNRPRRANTLLLHCSSVGMLNYLPIIGQAIQLVGEIVFSGLSDRVGRFPLLLVHSVSRLSGELLYTPSRAKEIY
jgi:hypothetical protein